MEYTLTFNYSIKINLKSLEIMDCFHRLLFKKLQ